jgi:hypothetical protein
MYTEIKLEKTRNFRYGMKAINKIEKALKTNVAKLDFDNLTMEDTATIIWAGLVHEDTELTPEKVMELIDEHSDIKTALAAMGEAFQNAFGGGDQEAKN